MLNCNGNKEKTIQKQKGNDEVQSTSMKSMVEGWKKEKIKPG